jgi:hypothetical protein
MSESQIVCRNDQESGWSGILVGDELFFEALKLLIIEFLVLELLKLLAYPLNSLRSLSLHVNHVQLLLLLL